MHLHGLNDLLVPYDGNANGGPTQDGFAYWAQVDTCVDDPEVSYSKGSSQCETHDDCGDGVKVSLCSINGGHILYTNMDSVPVAEIAWGFLSAHSLP